MPGSDNMFADLIPGSKGATPAPVYGAPDKPAALPSGWEADPENPGSIRPIRGGPEDPAANGILSDQTKDFFAQGVLMGSPIPAIGFGKEASRAKQDIMNRAAKMAGAEGMSGTDYAAQIAHYKAGTASITNMQKMHDTISQAERNALLDGQQYIQATTALPHQGGGPIFNTITQTWERYNPLSEGHDQIAAADAAYNTFINNYNRVVAGSPTGSGTMSDSSRKEAMDTLRNSLDPSQKATAFAQMKKDMANRMDAINSVIADQYKNLTRRYDQYTVPDDPAQAQLPDDWVKSHPDSVAAALAAAPKNKDGGGGGQNGPGGDPSGGGGPSSIGVTELTPDQKKAYAGFWRTNPNPSPEQLTTFLGSIGINNVSNASDIIKAEKEGRGYSSTAVNTSYQDKVKQRVKLERDTGIGPDPATTLVMQGGTLGLSDEAAGVGHALAETTLAPFTGRFDPIGDYQFGRDVERQRIADAREQLGYGGTAIELVGGAAALSPTEAVSALGGKAAAVAAGKAGAAGGALSGFGNGEGAGESVTGAGVGALTGYVAGRYTPAVVNKVLPRRFRPPQGMAPDLANAAQAEGVDLIRPMVDPKSRGDFGAFESNPVSQNIVRSGVDNTKQQIADRVGALGQGGTPMETATAGETLQGAGRRFIQRSKGVADALYNRARTIAGDARFVPQNAIDQVEQQVAQLRANPETNAGEINFLEGLHSDLATPGGKTVDELRQLRTSLRGRVNEQNLGATQAEARAIGVMDAAQKDVAQNVPQAASAFSRADTYYRERQTHIDDIIQRITGGKVGQTDYQVSGEQAFQKLKSMASPGGDGRRLAALMRELDPNERQDIAATIAQQLGRDSPDQPFSAAKFLSQTNKLSPSARRTIFGPDGAQSIQNLRDLSQALKDAGGDVNYSRSGSNVIRFAAKNFIGRITGLGAGAGLGLAAGGGEGAVVGAVGSAALSAANAGKTMLSARAMVNPRVSRWLAESANSSTPAQAKEATRKLGVIIAREPALAHELQPIYDMLQHRLDLPLAADPNQGGGGNNEQR